MWHKRIVRPARIIIFLCALMQHPVTGCLQLNGQGFLLPTSLPTSGNSDFSQRQIYLIPSLQFTCSGTIDRWEVYFRRIGTCGICAIQLQVWRLNSTMDCATGQFRLVGENTFQPLSVTSTEQPQQLPATDVIRVQPGDIVGFYTTRGRSLPQTNTTQGMSFGSDTTYTSQELSNTIMSLQDTCMFSTILAVPLLTAVVIPATVATEIPTTPPTSAVPMTISEPVTTPPPSQSTTPEMTSRPVAMVTTQAVTSTSASPATSEPRPPTDPPDVVKTTAPQQTSPSGGIGGTITGQTSPPGGIGGTTTDEADTATDSVNLNQGTGVPAPTEGVSLTTLILAVVIAIIGSAVVVVAMVLLFGCVWRRERRKRKVRLSGRSRIGNAQSLQNPIYGEESFKSGKLANDEQEEAQAYEIPLSTIQRYQVSPNHTAPSKIRDRPLPQVLGSPAKDHFLPQENIYDTPIDNTGQEPGVPLNLACPQPNENDFLASNNDYCDMSGALGMNRDQPNVSIYESLPN